MPYLLNWPFKPVLILIKAGDVKGQLILTNEHKASPAWAALFLFFSFHP